MPLVVEGGGSGVSGPPSSEPVSGQAGGQAEPQRKHSGFKPGQSGNPTGKPNPWKAKAEVLEREVAELRAWRAEREKADGVADDGEITWDRMKRVMGQSPILDRGQTETVLRSWLEKDVKGYEARMRQLADEESGVLRDREELAALRAEVAALRRSKADEGDEGTARARTLIRQIQEKYHE